MDLEEVKVMREKIDEILSLLDNLTLFDNLNKREWLDSKQAAYYLGISISELHNRCSNGSIPYSKLGRKNLYRREDLDELLLRNRRGGFK